MPKNHVKPTKEELEANAQRALEEAEALKEKEELEKNSQPTETEEPTGEEVPSTSPEVPEEEEELEEPAPSKEVIKDIAKRDKEKLIASAQEAQILHAKNKKMNEAIEKAMNVDEPSDEECQSDFPDWEIMSDFEKKMAKESLLNKKRMSALDEIVKENKDLESWSVKVSEFVESQETLTKYPDLDGKQDEFRLFATKPTRRGVDFEDIVSAFLFNQKPEPTKKGKMFEKGTGGSKDKMKPPSDKISIDQAIDLKKRDYRKYVELLKAGKIELGEI
jgi:hypothetical protein